MPSSWVVTSAPLISIASFSPTLLAISWPPSAYLWFKTLHVVGMVVAVTMAIGLLSVQPAWLHQGWMHAKLAVVALLVAYHVFCYRIMGQLQRGTCLWGARQLRALNELPTLLLVIAVMLVVFKQQFPTGAATWFLVALVVAMAASIQFYARWRRLRAERLASQEAGGAAA
jgi:putative membrane protein